MDERYRFAVGDSVRLVSAARISASSGPYEIVRRLPPQDGQHSYRIKSTLEQHERVATESELVRADGR